MPDHFHILMTPAESLERAVQCIKGGFSFRAKKQFGWNGEIWIAGFSDHRIRDEADSAVHQRYIHRNPVKAGLVQQELEYLYGSASGRYELDAVPQGLKPLFVAASGAAEAAPFQSADGVSRSDSMKDGMSCSDLGKIGMNCGDSAKDSASRGDNCSAARSVYEDSNSAKRASK